MEDNVKAVLEQSKAAIIIQNSNDRKSLKLFLKDLGVPVTNIEIVDPAFDWIDSIEAKKPNILCVSNDDQKRDYTEYLEYFSQSIYHELPTFILVLNDANNADQQVIELFSIDSVINRPYTVDDVTSSLKEAITKKVNLPEHEKLLQSLKTSLHFNDFVEIEKILEANKELLSPFADTSYFEAKLLLNMSENVMAKTALLEGLEKDNTNSLCLNLIIHTLVEEKDFKTSKKYINKLLNESKIQPEYLSSILKSAIANKNFLAITKIHNQSKNFNLSPEQKTMIGAGLIMCANNLLKTKAELRPKAKLLFNEVMQLNLESNLIISNALNGLIDCGDIQFVQTYIEKIPSDELDTNLLITELKLSALKDSPYKVIEKGTTLLQQDVKNETVYEILITKSVEARRDKKLIENLSFEAIKQFPQLKKHFESLY